MCQKASSLRSGTKVEPGTRTVRTASTHRSFCFVDPKSPARVNASQHKLIPHVSRKSLTRSYPHQNCLLKCLQHCLSPTREVLLLLFRNSLAVRVLARHLSGKNCLAAFRCLSGPSGEAGREGETKAGTRQSEKPRERTREKKIRFKMLELGVEFVRDS